jgi:hypothetical protein
MSKCRIKVDREVKAHGADDSRADLGDWTATVSMKKTGHLCGSGEVLTMHESVIAGS